MMFGKRKLSELSTHESSFDNESESLDTNDSTTPEDEGSHVHQVVEDSILTIAALKLREDKKPLADEVIFRGIATGKNPGGAKLWTCKHCKNDYNSSYTRIHYHFFGAPMGKKAGIQRCPALVKDWEAYEALRKRVQAVEKQGVSSSLRCSTVTKKENAAYSKLKPIQDSFQIMERDNVDLKVVRPLCANGIPFNVLRNPQFVEMVTTINNGPKGYKAPSFEKSRTVLLDKCKTSIEKNLAPVKETWYTQGVSVVSNGWTNVKHMPLIKVLAVNSRGAMFLYADDFSGIEQTGHAIAQYLLKAIEEVGPHNVLQVVTDNASNCKVAGREIEQVHKHIFRSPCVVHTLNLIFKDFASKFEWLKKTYMQGKEIVKYILNHTHALAMFRANSRLELLKVAKTIFASHYILLKRLYDCKEALATTTVLNSWQEWVNQGDENSRLMGSLVAETIRDAEFWDDVENVIKITKPIYLLIKFCDGEGLKMGEIYEKMDTMLGEIQVIMKNNKYAECFDDMESTITTRWTNMNYTIHCLGFALTPRFYDAKYLGIPAPRGMPRKAPNQDSEVIKAVMEAFAKIAENAEEQKLLRDQFATFHTKKGIYSMAAAQLDVVTMDSITWLATYGSQTPELVEVAKKVLSEPISSSLVERLWSTYSYIHNVKRNKLNCSRADKLVFIHSNIRLQSRFCESYKHGPCKQWDMDPENSSLEEFVPLEPLDVAGTSKENHCERVRIAKGASKRLKGKKA